VAVVIPVAVPIVVAVPVVGVSRLSDGGIVLRGGHHRDVRRRHRSLGCLGRRRRVVVFEVAPGVSVTLALVLV
jgi:hypothetical protein